MDALWELADVIQQANRDPASNMTWADWAVAFLADPATNRVVRAANQVGKTTVVCADIVHLLRGTNPTKPRPWEGPINVLLASKSLEQMYQPGGIVEKLWAMLPKEELDPSLSFVPGKGILGTKYPVIRFTTGPAAGSTIILRTYGQDPQTLAGMTIHAAYCDEPAPKSFYDELAPRLWRHRGFMTISFTPTMDMPDQSWLKALVADGVFSEHHVVMSEQNCWPKGLVRPFYDAAYIEEKKRGTPILTRAMRFEASWDPVVTDRYLSAFGPEVVRAFGFAEIPKRHLVVVSMDHGLKPGKNAAVMSIVSEWWTARPKVWAVNEFQPDGYSRPEQIARGILDMVKEVLGRPDMTHREAYEVVDVWVGDIEAQSRKHRAGLGNKQIRQELQRLAKLDHHEAKWIERANKKRGTVELGLHLLNALMERSDCTIHPRCVKLAKACERFKGKKDDPHKDVLDAWRYGPAFVCEEQESIVYMAQF